MDVGEATVDAVVVVGEALVVDSQLVQHGGVKIVPMDAVFNGLPPKFIGSPIGDPWAPLARNFT